MRTKELLTEDLHLRVSKRTHDQLQELANKNHLKLSTLTRYLLVHALPQTDGLPLPHRTTA